MRRVDVDLPSLEAFRCNNGAFYNYNSIFIHSIVALHSLLADIPNLKTASFSFIHFASSVSIHCTRSSDTLR